MRACTLEEKSLFRLLHHHRQNLSFDRQVLLPWPFTLARDLFSNKSVQWDPHLIEMDRKISLNIKNPNILTERVIKPCHRLPTEAVESPFLETFKT